MTTELIIKVCGITRREDALAAVDAGASALGFIFYPKSPRYVTPHRAAELGEGLDIWKVGIFVDQPADAVEQAAHEAQLDVVQIYGGETPTRPRVWRAFRVKEGVDPHLAAHAEAVLLDGPANGQGFDWRDARRLAEPMGLAERVIVAGGLNASNVAEAIHVARPWGVDASSGLETAPGVKDHDKIRRYVAAAREAAAEQAQSKEKSQ